jgi:hypothetical protein
MLWRKKLLWRNAVEKESVGGCVWRLVLTAIVSQPASHFAASQQQQQNIIIIVIV